MFRKLSDYLKFTLILFLLLPVHSISALTFDPPVGDYDSNEPFTIEVKADNGLSQATAVQIRLEATNMTIEGFTPTTSKEWLTPTGDCVDHNFTTDSEVCVSMATTTNITPGESLGVLSVKMPPKGGGIISAQESNGYSDGVKFYPQLGAFGSYTIKSDSTSKQPENTESSVRLVIIGIILIALIIIGFLLVRTLLRLRNQKRIENMPN
jgi:hypothetical protein